MEAPVETVSVPATHQQSRTAWMGWAGVVVAFVALCGAVLGLPLFGARSDRASERAGSEEAGGKYRFSIQIGDKKAEIGKTPAATEGKRGLKDWFLKRTADVSVSTTPPETTASPPRSEGMARFWQYGALVGGLIATALGTGSWIRREDHRVSVAALSLALFALLWHWIALGVAVGVAIWVLIHLLANSAPP